MEEIKQKHNILGTLRETIETGVELGKNAIDNIKDAMDTPQVRRMQVITSFAKLGLLGNVSSINTIIKTMFPFESKGTLIPQPYSLYYF